MTLDESIHPAPRPNAEVERRRALPPALAALLHAAREDEQRALGPQRRAAYLLTRNIISAAFTAGYPPRLVAAELGVTSESLRTRAQPGWVRLSDIALLAGLGPSELDARLGRSGFDAPDGRIHSDQLVGLLLAAE